MCICNACVRSDAVQKRGQTPFSPRVNCDRPAAAAIKILHRVSDGFMFFYRPNQEEGKFQKRQRCSKTRWFPRGRTLYRCFQTNTNCLNPAAGVKNKWAEQILVNRERLVSLVLQQKTDISAPSLSRQLPFIPRRIARACVKTKKHRSTHSQNFFFFSAKVARLAFVSGVS